MPPEPAFLVSCEHASNAIPEASRSLFTENAEVLSTHHAHDLGALEAAREIAEILRATVHVAPVSRLICDCNRSPGHPNLFCKAVSRLSSSEKRSILERYYWPYRHAVIDDIAHHLASGRTVVHLSVHSFTPVLNERTRTAEVGLLFDPSREKERRAVGRLRRALIAQLPDLLVRNNYPYRGTSDGMTSALRRIHSDTRYLGFELELNQRLWTEESPRWGQIGKAFADALIGVFATGSADSTC